MGNIKLWIQKLKLNGKDLPNQKLILHMTKRKKKKNPQKTADKFNQEKKRKQNY